MVKNQGETERRERERCGMKGEEEWRGESDGGRHWEEVRWGERGGEGIREKD